jgi:exodeoxyribonuclease VII small subunit
MSPTEPTSAKPPEQYASFEAALEKLEALVAGLESGDVPLEKSILAFEEAQRLIAYCEQKLQAAEKALKQLGQDAQNALGPANPTRS